MVAVTTAGLRDTTASPSTLSQAQWAVAAGTVDAITATYPVTNTSYSDGLILGFRASGRNTSTTPTFSPDGLSAKTITKIGGKALQAGDIPRAGYEVLVRYNNTASRWELLNPDPFAQIQWAAAGGTADALTATFPDTITALTDGLLVAVRAANPNATTTPTFAPDGLTAHTITKRGNLALAPGDIAGTGHELLLRYNLANTVWELLTPTIRSGTWVAGGGSADAITATYSPAVQALTDGLELGFRAASDSLTTTPTFSPNGLTARTITKNGGAALVPGDIKANGEYFLRYNLANTRWELLNHSPLADEAIYVLAADDTGGQNVNTAQPLFPTTGGVTLKGNTTYEFEIRALISRSAGTTSHTTSVLFGGTATLTSIAGFVEVMTGDANTLVSTSGVWITAATATSIKAASTSATEQIAFTIRGIVRVNAAGTFIPQFQYSAAPGGAPTIKANSMARFRPIGNGSVVTKGTWS